MASPGINFIRESEGQPDHRDVCAYRSDLRPQLIRSGQFRGKRRRENKTEPLRRLMAAVLCEAVNRFQRNLFHTSLPLQQMRIVYHRGSDGCRFVGLQKRSRAWRTAFSGSCGH